MKSATPKERDPFYCLAVYGLPGDSVTEVDYLADFGMMRHVARMRKELLAFEAEVEKHAALSIEGEHLEALNGLHAWLNEAENFLRGVVGFPLISDVYADDSYSPEELEILRFLRRDVKAAA